MTCREIPTDQENRHFQISVSFPQDVQPEGGLSDPRNPSVLPERGEMTGFATLNPPYQLPVGGGLPAKGA